MPQAQALGECPHRTAAQGECPAGHGRHSSAGSTAGLPSPLPQPTRGRRRAASSGCPHLGGAHFLSSRCKQHRDPFLRTSWDSASWCLLPEESWGDLLLKAQVNPETPCAWGSGMKWKLRNGIAVVCLTSLGWWVQRCCGEKNTLPFPQPSPCPPSCKGCYWQKNLIPLHSPYLCLSR